MDDIDREILNILQENDKIQYYKIAEMLDIGTSTVHFRIKKMMKNGIISKFSANIDPAKVGYETIAWIGISVDATKMDDIARELIELDHIQIVATSTGDHDIVVQVVARNEKHLWKFINEHIKTIPGIGKNFHVSSFLDIYKKDYKITL